MIDLTGNKLVEKIGGLCRAKFSLANEKKVVNKLCSKNYFDMDVLSKLSRYLLKLER